MLLIAIVSFLRRRYARETRISGFTGLPGFFVTEAAGVLFVLLRLVHINPIIWRRDPPLSGKGRSFDAKPLIEQGGVFLPLRNEDFFRTHLTVLNDAVAWDINGTRDELPQK